jgi:hypothetical protein
MEEILRAVDLTQNAILRMNYYLQRRYETEVAGGHLEYAFV